MTKIPGRCDRCGKPTNITIMSFFNEEIICMQCDEKERTHPDYEKAREAELHNIHAGNYNYKGIGKPNDL